MKNMRSSLGHRTTTPLWRRCVYWSIAVAVAVICVYYILQKISWPLFLNSLSRAHFELSIIILPLIVFTCGIRAFRWKLLLSTKKSVPFTTTFWAVNLGYLLNTVFPARAGDISRSIIIAEHFTMSRVFTIATTFTERGIDLLTLILLSAISLFFLPQIPAWVGPVVGSIGIFTVVVAIAFLLAPHADRILKTLGQWLPIVRTPLTFIAPLITKITSAVIPLHSPVFALRYFSLTLLIWAMDALGAILTGTMFNLHLGFPQIFLLYVALGFSSILPTVPGNIGMYQMVGITVLAPFGIGREPALLFLLSFQAINYLISLLFGLIALSKFSCYNGQKHIRQNPGKHGVKGVKRI